MLKVQTSNNKQHIYVGKEELKILEMLEKSCTLLNKGKNVVPFVDIKLLPNYNLVVHEEGTLDLVLFDPNMKEIRRLPRPALGQNSFKGTYKTIRHGSSDSFYGWFVGSSTLNLVELSTFNFKAIPGFFGSQTESSLPYAVVTSESGTKASGLYLNNHTNLEHLVVYISGFIGSHVASSIMHQTRSSQNLPRIVS